MTRDDWVRIYGEFVEWMDITPQERWRESTRLWVAFFALGGRIDDDLTDDGLIDDNAAWRQRLSDAQCDVVRLRRCDV